MRPSICKSGMADVHEEKLVKQYGSRILMVENSLCVYSNAESFIETYLARYPSYKASIASKTITIFLCYYAHCRTGLHSPFYQVVGGKCHSHEEYLETEEKPPYEAPADDIHTMHETFFHWSHFKRIAPEILSRGYKIDIFLWSWHVGANCNVDPSVLAHNFYSEWLSPYPISYENFLTIEDELGAKFKNETEFESFMEWKVTDPQVAQKILQDREKERLGKEEQERRDEEEDNEIEEEEYEPKLKKIKVSKKKKEKVAEENQVL